jgi:NADPH:quinone reductase-like Zn-dependent oxidoreductase
MKSYWIKAADGGTQLELRDVPTPRAGAGQIVVRMRAASLNRGELLASIGLHSANEPRPAGGDLAGVVEAVGDGVSGFKPGDRVMGRARGSFAESVMMLAEQAVHIPQRLSFEQAAAMPTVCVTAWEILCQYGRLKAGETLLVAGASSGVGTVCVQFGRHLGAKVLGTSGSAEKLAKLTTLGLHAGIHARDRFSGKVLELTGGKGANLAVNLIGGTAFPECLRALANQGRMAIVGYVDRTLKSEIDLEAVHGKRLQIYGVSNAHLTAAERAVAFSGFVRDMLPAYADGSLAPVIDKVFAFDELPAAKAYVDSDAQLGKVVVQLK